MAIDDLGPAPNADMWAEPTASAAYPADLRFGPPARFNRLWAFPILGGAVKLIALIPHLVIVILLAVVFSPGQIGRSAGLALWILWIPVLFGGKLPTWGYAFVGGFLRWSTRVTAFLLGLTDRYPAFSMHSGLGDVEVTFHIPASNNRWWALPVLGFYVKLLILIPHYICLTVLGFCALILWLVMWIPVLLTGRYPPGPYWFSVGVLRWNLRVSAFLGGLTDRYPPFSLA